MAEEINARIRHVGKTESQWLADDTVLLEGELGYATDTQVIKVGNGQDVWRDLKSHQGERGPRGPKGDPFTYDDLTDEQILAIRGVEIDTSGFVSRNELNEAIENVDVSDQLAGKADVNHTHDERYSKIGHTHSEYARKEEVPKIERVTQSEYDSLSKKDDNTLYLVVD